MCSIVDPRLALIGLAIDELAEAARVAAGDPGPGTPGTTAEGTTTQDSESQDAMAQDTMAERVARIWAMVADLDPGLAHRLSQYTDQPTTSQPTTGNTSTGQPTPDPGHA
jgi:hypothetical protein